MNFSPFPELQTNRLLLRQVTDQDCSIILYLRSDKIVNKYIQRPPERQTKTEADALKHIQKLNNQIAQNTSITWAITLKDNPELIGTICLWNFSNQNKTAELGYDLNPIHQKKGIMTEALQTVVDFAFNNLKFNTIEAYTQNQNASSIKLLESNGFNLNESKKDKDNPKNLIFQLQA